ncbi:MAG: hypothetical protein AAB660_00685 [Patescibacteria group bacterium]
MKYRLSEEDFEKVFDFSVKYHLDPQKSSTTRTAGSARGLGGVLDSFMHGKLIEIGVAHILSSLSPEKELITDFDIKKTSEAKDDPDIVSVMEKGSKRGPNIYVEIKNISLEDRYVGMTVEQFDTAKSIAKGEIYIVGAYLSNEKVYGKKERDALGMYLKKRINNPLLAGFANMSGADVVIDYAISGKELETNGIKFLSESLFYETELFTDPGPQAIKLIERGDIPRVLVGKDIKLDLYMQNPGHKTPEFMGPLEIVGQIEIFEKINEKSLRRYIRCISDVKITSSSVGEFLLQKGKIYLFNMTTMGRNPFLDRNNLWIAKRNIPFLQKKGLISGLEDNLLKIATKI